MKKALKLCALFLVLTICMSMSAVTTSADNTVFSDVNETDYFYPAVIWGAEAGITLGVGDGLFAPDGEITRAQIVTFLWRMAGQPAPVSDSSFADVEEGSWYETAVQWAVENDVTIGTGDGMFSPYVICDRAMCITMLYRFFGSPMDGIDVSVPMNVDDDVSFEDITAEEYIERFIRYLIQEFREEKYLLDVSENDYYEFPVIWATFYGILTEDNTTVSEDGITFRPSDPCVRKEMISFLYQVKLVEDLQNAPVEYYFGDYTLPIPQEYYDFLAINVNVIDEDDSETDEETMITVSELASQEATEAMGEDPEGQGELFRIVRVSEERLHELLCGDMSGIMTFAKDGSGNYYQLRYPTDVRYVRESIEKMNEDIDQWTELNSWARDGLDNEIISYNDGLTPVSFTNTMLDMYLARIAYAKDVKYTLSTTEFGPIEPGSVDGTKYAEYLLKGNFTEIGDAEAPDGEYVVLNFPEDGVRYDFFLADRDLVREVREDYTTFYRRAIPGSLTNDEVMESWYLTLAEAAGKKEDYKELDPFIGTWHEEIAGRGTLNITKSVGLAKVDVEARWPGSAFEVSTWDITANLADDGKLVYYDCNHLITEYDENGKGTVVSEVTNENGIFSLTDEGKLLWKRSDSEEESTFVRD